MSRNANKLPKNTEEEVSEKKEQTKKELKPDMKDNPFGLSFVVPTEMVDLPSAGKYYPSSHPLHEISQVEIKHMTAKEEDILSAPISDSEGLLFDKLANSIICSKDIKAEDLIEDDKMAILLQARITGYGPEYSTKIICSNCNSEYGATFDLTKTTFQQPTQGEYDPEANTFSFTAPVSNVKLVLKNFTLQDEDILKEDEKRKRKLNLPFSASEAFLNLVILSANDVTDRKLIRSLVEVLPAGDVKSIKTFYNNCQPRLSLLQETKCTECLTVSEREVPLSWAFFRTDV
tara:strand:+ start:65 stop:931 length:867 start_codon:yes stop_codon:yes gene_type:complete